MNKFYKIDGRNQVKSISNGLRILLWIPLALLVAYFRGVPNSLLDPDIITVIVVFTLVYFLPALVLHIIYYLANRDTEIEIDSTGNTVIIISRNERFHLKTKELKRVERVLNRDYRLPKWQQNWFPISWRNYGYLKLVTKDNEVFLLTSLLLDPLNPPIQPTVTRYSFVPFLDNEVYVEPSQEELEEDYRSEIDCYKVKFQNHTEEELIKKTIANGYRKEAAIAANEILKERNYQPTL